MPSRLVNFAIAVAVVLACAANAAAQPPAAVAATPTFDLSAAYQYLHVPDENFPFGINIDGARHFGRLGIVAEAGWAMDSDDQGGVKLTTHMWNFGAGPRWTAFSSSRVWPYAHLIVGAAVAHNSVEIVGVHTSDTQSAFMLQPGAGVTYVAGDGWGVFAQADYRRTFFDEPPGSQNSINNNFRLLFGLRAILD